MIRFVFLTLGHRPQHMSINHISQEYFNVARDNEARGARHANRSDVSLQALNISSARVNYPDLQHVDLQPEDVGAMSDMLGVGKALFHAHKSGNSKFLHFDSKEILDARSKWPSTKPDRLESHQALLLKVLNTVPEEMWANLWMCAMFRPHMLITTHDLTDYYYVLWSTESALVLLRLKKLSDFELSFNYGPEDFSITAPVSFEHYLVVEYSLKFSPAETESPITFVLDVHHTDIFEFACKNEKLITTLKLPLLRKLAKHFHIKIPAKSPHIECARTLMEARLIDPGVRDRALDALAAVIAKRSRKKKSSDEAGSAQPNDDDSEDDSDSSDSEAEETLRGDVPKLLQELADREVWGKRKVVALICRNGVARAKTLCGDVFQHSTSHADAKLNAAYLYLLGVCEQPDYSSYL